MGFPSACMYPHSYTQVHVCMCMAIRQGEQLQMSRMDSKRNKNLQIMVLPKSIVTGSPNSKYMSKSDTKPRDTDNEKLGKHVGMVAGSNLEYKITASRRWCILQRAPEKGHI